MSDKIQCETLVNAPIDRVWEAIGDHRRFGEWFKVAIDQPFEVGKPSTGQITSPAYSHVRWTAEVVAVEPPRRLAFHWHPYAVEQGRDYGNEPMTPVDITLEPDGGGTRVRVVESGFDALPASRRDEAFRMNEGGWKQQLANVRAYVEG